jgi:hypothetical protein
MEIIITIYLLACVLALIYCFVMLYKNELEIKKLKKLKQRNEHLYDYRVRILYENKDAYDKLPTYDEMLNSNKPLEDIYWIKTT